MSWLPKLAAVVAAVALVLSGTPAHAADAPRAAIRTPTTGASVEVGLPVLFSGNAWNGESGGIVSVELSLDGGTTWFEVGTNENWRYAYTPAEPGVLTVVARSSTNSVVGPPTEARTLHVGLAGSPPPVSCDDCGFWLSAFTAPHDGVHGASVYHYGVGGGFPTDSWNDATYWVTPYFRG